MEYLILDCYHSSLTRGALRSSPSAPILEFEIPEADVARLEEVESNTTLQFIGFDESSPSFAGKITRRRGNRLAVERGAALGEDPREELRAPYFFTSYVYSMSGEWQGRSAIQTYDLSCGGIGFTCNRRLTSQERVELAVPLTDGVLLIPGKIIRPQEGETHQPGESIHYVAKFMSGIEEVEVAIRKEVLKQQLNHRDKKGGAERRITMFQE